MLCRNVKVEIFEQSTAAALQTAVNDWLIAREEETIIDISYDQNAGSTFWAYVTYSDG